MSKKFKSPTGEPCSLGDFLAHCSNKHPTHGLRAVREELINCEQERQKLLSLAMKDNRAPLASEQRSLDSLEEAIGDLQRTELELADRENAIRRQRDLTITDDDYDGPIGFGPIGFGREAGTYRQDGPHSFFRDVVFARQDPDAQERLLRNQREVEVQRRDVTSAAAGAGGFIPPIYLGEAWAELARPDRPFANIVPTMPMPDVGLQVQVPKVQTGTTVAVQSAENVAVSETDIDTQSVTANLCTIAGMNDISLQSLERSFPGMDQVIYADLLAAHDQKLDTQLLAGAGSSGEHQGIRGVTGHLTVTYTDSTPTAAEFLPKIYDAIQKVASNRYRNATHVVMHPRRAAWAASNLSSTFPLFQQGQLTQAVGQQEGGFVSSFGGLTVVLDPNIGTSYGASTNEDECYVLHVDDLILMESPVQFVRFDDVLSGNLTVRLRLHSYSFFVPDRHPESVCVLSSTGLAAPSF